MSYLERDITGAYSHIEYGKKGDSVEIIDDSREMILVDNNGVRFHVRLSDLSEVAIEEEIQDPVVEQKPVEVKSYSKPVKRKIEQKPQSDNQSQLF